MEGAAAHLLAVQQRLPLPAAVDAVGYRRAQQRLAKVEPALRARRLRLGVQCLLHCRLGGCLQVQGMQQRT